jgi:tetratricopeptide (TPR) repeat protein
MLQKTIINLILLALFLSTHLLANLTKSEEFVTAAWKAWENNDHQLVETKFLAAVDVDKNNTRAYLGLFFLYSFQDKKDQAWEIFKNVLRTEKDYYPYIYAIWLTTPMTRNYYKEESGIMQLFEELAQKADHQGILKAMACSELGPYYDQKNKFINAEPFYKKVNHIGKWKLIGPFDNISASGFEKIYPPEYEFDPEKKYEGKNNIPVFWFDIEENLRYQWINFRNHFAHYQSVFYANNFVYSPEKQSVQLRVGTSGSLKIFLNEEQLYEYFDENNNDLDTYIVETELQEGWNRLLIKCGFSIINRCNFLARITNSRGEPIKGLKISTEKQNYISKPGTPAKYIDIFAEVFFKEKIKQHPDHLENYILLTEAYMRNDKAVEGELVLREAIRLSPNCALLYYHILESYRRSEKEDERATTFERIYSLDKNVPDVLEYKIEKSFENEDFEKAEELIRHLETLLPESESVYEQYITLYGKKKQLEKMFNTLEAAYNKYPTNWTFASTVAMVAVRAKQDYDRALEVYNSYLKYRYTNAVLSNLANTYLKLSNLEKWEETYLNKFKISPVAPGYLSHMAKTYQVQQDYEKAEKMIQVALKICPSSSIYWSKLGELKRAQNMIDESIQAYKKVLKYNPTNYEAREALRELKGKKSIFHQFGTSNIIEMIKNAPGANEYPNDHAIFLFNDAKRIIYERGASEASDEILVRVFNNIGLDYFKEYWIEYNSNIQKLTIEKAVVIKSDGSEIKADINDNHIVFKSLEILDFIHIKYKIKNYFSGRLAKHFWDSFYFNRFLPSKTIRYSMLVHNNQKFHIKVQNMPNEPVKKKTEEGTLYQWSLQDEPAIVFEYGMPILDDIGKMLYISSFDDWQYLVDWYSELTKTKTRSSHEIKEQVAKLFEGKENLSEEEKIELIYFFITENIRYSNIAFRQSDFIPQKARDVLVTKIGDCKDLTTLGIAMLNEIGIKAYYVRDHKKLTCLLCIHRKHGDKDVQKKLCTAKAEKCVIIWLY